MRHYRTLRIPALDRRRFLGLSAAALAAAIPLSSVVARARERPGLSLHEAGFYHRREPGE